MSADEREQEDMVETHICAGQQRPVRPDPRLLSLPLLRDHELNLRQAETSQHRSTSAADLLVGASGTDIRVRLVVE